MHYAMYTYSIISRLAVKFLAAWEIMAVLRIAVKFLTGFQVVIKINPLFPVFLQFPDFWLSHYPIFGDASDEWVEHAI